MLLVNQDHASNRRTTHSRSYQLLNREMSCLTTVTARRLLLLIKTTTCTRPANASWTLSHPSCLWRTLQSGISVLSRHFSRKTQEQLSCSDFLLTLMNCCSAAAPAPFCLLPSRLLAPRHPPAAPFVSHFRIHPQKSMIFLFFFQIILHFLRATISNCIPILCPTPPSFRLSLLWRPASFFSGFTALLRTPTCCAA